MTEYQPVRVGHFVGGPYDGVTISGSRIPDAIKIAADKLVSFSKDPEERRRIEAAHQIEKSGTYYAGDEFVHINKQLVELYGLLEQTPDAQITDLFAQCDWMPGTDDERLILVTIRYEWVPGVDR